MNPSLTKRIWYDLADAGSRDPRAGDYLVTRTKDGGWGTAYMVVGAYKVKRRVKDPGWRRFALHVQKQPAVTPEILRLAQFWMQWAPRHRSVHQPSLL